MHGPICSECGQKFAEPFHTSRIFKDVWSHFLELDYKFIRTIKEIFTAPGTLINNYLHGKRVLYTNPFKFLFFVATAYYFMIDYFGITVSIEGNAQLAENFGDFIILLFNYLVFIFLIPTAFLFKKIYKKANLNFAESYIATCYLWSGYLLVAIPLSLLLNLFDHYNIFIRMAVGLTFLLFATQQMFKIKWSTALYKIVLIFFSYIFSALLIMFILIGLSYLVGFEPLMIFQTNNQG